MRRDVAILLIASAILVLFRLHAFDLPLETDECNYAYIAGRLLAGDRLYVDVWDHQPPGVYMLFAGVIATFGDSPPVFRWMATVFSLASLILIYAILRRVAHPFSAGLGAALFAIVSSDPGVGGEGCNREIYMNALILAGWYMALKEVGSHEVCVGKLESSLPSPGSTEASPVAKRGIVGVAIAGLFIALASLLKTNAAIHWALLAVWLSVVAVGSGDPARRVRRLLSAMAAFAVGPVLIWAGTFAYFAATQRLREFIDSAFLFNLGYADVREPFLMRFWRFFAPLKHPFIFESALPLWLLTIPAVLFLIFRSTIQRCRASLAILLLLLASYAATCLPGRFWPHYYYLLIPSIVMTVATALGTVISVRLREGDAISSQQSSIDNPKSADCRFAVVQWGIATILAGAVLCTETRHYLMRSPMDITMKRYNTRDFWGRAQGENVARVTDPTDSVFVFGNDAEIYYYSRRKCASRYTMITGLQAGMHGAEQRRRTLMDELGTAPPRVLIVLLDEDPFPEWLSFLDQYYGPAVGVDYHDVTGKPIMFVFVRKDDPIGFLNWDWDRSQVGESPPRHREQPANTD